MDGNDGRYDKSKPREATDQYSLRQYDLYRRMEEEDTNAASGTDLVLAGL